MLRLSSLNAYWIHTERSFCSNAVTWHTQTCQCNDGQFWKLLCCSKPKVSRMRSCSQITSTWQVCIQFSFGLYIILKPRNVLANKLVSYVQYVQLGNVKRTTHTEELRSRLPEVSCVAAVVMQSGPKTKISKNCCNSRHDTKFCKWCRISWNFRLLWSPWKLTALPINNCTFPVATAWVQNRLQPQTSSLLIFWRKTKSHLSDSNLVLFLLTSSKPLVQTF